MIKICSESLTIPLKIKFEQSPNKGKFPEIFKKANVVLVHKKDNKNFVQLAYFPSLIQVLKE